LIVIIDTETTGLIDQKSKDFMKQPGITQLGAIKLDSKLKEIGRFSTLVNPELAEGAWSKEAISVTGIGPKEVKDAPSYLGTFAPFAKFISGSLFWTGYNTGFDQDVIHYQNMRYGMERNFPWPLHCIDAMRLVSDHLNGKGKRGVKRWKLGDAYAEIMGEELKDAHDAVADCIGVADIIRKIGFPL
jgi:DNA polymerase III epsilon subunit-like protein